LTPDDEKIHCFVLDIDHRREFFLKFKRDEDGNRLLRRMMILQGIGFVVIAVALGVSLWTYSKLTSPPATVEQQPAPFPTVTPFSPNMFNALPDLKNTASKYVSRPFSTWTEQGDSRAWVEFDGLTAQLQLQSATNIPPWLQPFTLSPMPNWTHQREFVWSPDGSGSLAPTQRLIWSPDSRYVLLEYYNVYPHYGRAADTWYYSVYGADGIAISEFVSIPFGVQNFEMPRVLWLGDSQTLLFTRGTDNRPYFYHVPQRQFMANIRDTSLTYPVFERVNGKTTILLARGDAAPVVLIENADSAGEPAWSPDGGWVGVVWGTGKGDPRSVQLTWMRADGTYKNVIRDAEEKYENIHDVRWITVGEPTPTQQIAYIASRKGGQRLEFREAQTAGIIFTGEVQHRIERMNYRPVSRLLNYWWRDKEGNVGISSYGLDGRRAMHNAIPVKIEGREVFRDPYNPLGVQEIFPNVTGEFYVVRSRSGVVEPIQWTAAIVRADGSSAKALPVASRGMSRPCWTDYGTLYLYHHPSDQLIWQLIQIDPVLATTRDIPIDGEGANNRAVMPCMSIALK
jgi:hypothetical protein